MPSTQDLLIYNIIYELSNGLAAEQNPQGFEGPDIVDKKKDTQERSLVLKSADSFV